MLAHVDHRAALAVDHAQRALQLFAAVTALRAKYIPGEALRMHADQGRNVRIQLAFDDGHVLVTSGRVLIADGGENAAVGGEWIASVTRRTMGS
jgi:hypothetical protein